MATKNVWADAHPAKERGSHRAARSVRRRMHFWWPSTWPSGSGISTAAGELTVSVAGHDLFWHTFTIESLGIDLLVPVGARSSTFDVEPGTSSSSAESPAIRRPGWSEP